MIVSQGVVTYIIYKISNGFIPILNMKRLRFREVKYLDKFSEQVIELG